MEINADHAFVVFVCPSVSIPSHLIFFASLWQSMESVHGMQVEGLRHFEEILQEARASAKILL